MRRALVLLLATAACAPAASGPGTGSSGGSNTQMVSSDGNLSVSTDAQLRIVSTDLPATPEQVYAVLPAVFQELGLTATANAGQHAVSAESVITRRFQGESAGRYFDCGRGQYGVEIAMQNEIRVAVRTTVAAGTSGGSRLDTGIEASARNPTGSANALMAVCHSRGALEQLIAARVRAKLGA